MATSNRILPLVVASALFMENMDSTVIATSLPAMAADLGTSPVALKLAFTTYLLSLTIFLPVTAWVSERFGARRVFRLAIVVFTLAALACGWAQSLGDLVAARFLQGLGGAMMTPVGRIILLRAVPKSELVGALAWLTVPALIGPLVGPPVGGFITTYFDWRWIFWMHVPIGLIGVVMASVFMAKDEPGEVRPLDVKGFVLSSIGLSATVFGLTIAGRDLFTGRETVALIVFGAVMIALYVAHARRVDNPILDLKLLGVQTLRTSIYSGFYYRLAAGAFPFLIPLLLQLGFGYDAFQSGLMTCSAAVGAIAMKFMAASLLKTFGYRSVLSFNGFVSSLGMLALGLLTVATPIAVVCAVILLGAMARSLQFTAFNSIAYADIASQDIARANGLYTVGQQLSITLGVAVAAAALDVSQWLRGANVLATSDFRNAFFLVAAIGLLAIVGCLRLPRNAGAELSGHNSG